jgi:hypothetical protein
MANEMEKHVPLFEEWLAVNEISGELAAKAATMAKDRNRFEQGNRMAAGAVERITQQIGGVPFDGTLKILEMDGTKSIVKISQPKGVETKTEHRTMTPFVDNLLIAYNNPTPVLKIVANGRDVGDVKNLIIDTRRNARLLHKLINLIKNTDEPFEVDKYTIKEIHGNF